MLRTVRAESAGVSQIGADVAREKGCHGDPGKKNCQRVVRQYEAEKHRHHDSVAETQQGVRNASSVNRNKARAEVIKHDCEGNDHRRGVKGKKGEGAWAITKSQYGASKGNGDLQPEQAFRGLLQENVTRLPQPMQQDDGEPETSHQQGGHPISGPSGRLVNKI
ncbi:hypothetical protein QKG26_gp085 [Chelonid alphaherpesvirus 5]|uniref:Uncharacterized protein n=1 Tax=Chelonid alphaherpesvirus 5 TaxID=702736 RepID=V5NWS8_9ALPH|nr:hypothetical protein QKG26_gp085 [Chelonid alphaherpesvirus 5]AHA93372.1 hypothetical protein [Chelonid alphaherpesvirus 5]